MIYESYRETIKIKFKPFDSIIVPSCVLYFKLKKANTFAI